MHETFLRHLRALLPLTNISQEFNSNQVVAYSLQELNRLNIPFTVDVFGNSTCSRGKQAIVAHTDSVDDGSSYRGLQEIEEGPLRWVNLTAERPMGADDKIGVAIALTLAEFLPDLSVWLLADEEVGLLGAQHFDAPSVTLAVECDRQGNGEAPEMAIKIENTWLCSPEFARRASTVLPHRKVVAGGATDVLPLVQLGLAMNAVNLSCGYYLPHQRDEFIVIPEALEALEDALTLLRTFRESS